MSFLDNEKLRHKLASMIQARDRAMHESAFDLAFSIMLECDRAFAGASPETGTADPYAWLRAGPAPEPVKPPAWVIVAAHISTNGVAYFWGPNFSGYTASLARAGRYTEQEAKKREVWSERMEVAVPLAEAEEAQFPAVTDDNAHAWFRRRFPGPKPGEPVKPPVTCRHCKGIGRTPGALGDNPCGYCLETGRTPAAGTAPTAKGGR